MSGIQVQRSSALRNPCFEPPNKKADQKQEKQYLNINKLGAYTTLWKALFKVWCYILNSAVKLILKCEKPPTNNTSPTGHSTTDQCYHHHSEVILKQEDLNQKCQGHL